MTPQQFAEILCDDLDLPPHHFVPLVTESINSQVEEFETYNDFYVIDEEDETNSRLTINVRSNSFSEQQIERDKLLY